MEGRRCWTLPGYSCRCHSDMTQVAAVRRAVARITSAHKHSVKTMRAIISPIGKPLQQALTSRVHLPALRLKSRALQKHFGSFLQCSASLCLFVICSVSHKHGTHVANLPESCLMFSFCSALHGASWRVQSLELLAWPPSRHASCRCKMSGQTAATPPAWFSSSHPSFMLSPLTPTWWKPDILPTCVSFYFCAPTSRNNALLQTPYVCVMLLSESL